MNPLLFTDAPTYLIPIFKAGGSNLLKIISYSNSSIKYHHNILLIMSEKSSSLKISESSAFREVNNKSCGCGLENCQCASGVHCSVCLRAGCECGESCTCVPLNLEEQEAQTLASHTHHHVNEKGRVRTQAEINNEQLKKIDVMNEEEKRALRAHDDYVRSVSIAMYPYI